MRRITIEVSDTMARRALLALRDGDTGQFIARGCQCVGCKLLRKVRDALAAAQKEKERG